MKLCSSLIFFLSLLLLVSRLHCIETNDCQDTEKAPKENENKPSETHEDPKEDKIIDAKKEESKPEKEDEQKPPPIGNFALPTSQQPATLFGFGGNIIDEGEVQIFYFADDFNGPKKTLIEVIPSVLFGITNECTIFFNFPFTPLLREGPCRSRGLQDFFVQLEYAFYNKTTYCYLDQATVVTNITVPTGSVRKNPPTGFGSPSFFIGGTFYRTYVDWVFFTAQGAILTTSEHGTKIGDQFLYQFGLARNIPSPEGWIYALMLDLDGMYSKRNRIRGRIDRNSGGNAIFVTPSIWISSRDFIFQFGVSFPVNQNLFGKQNKFAYALNLDLTWSFY